MTMKRASPQVQAVIIAEVAVDFGQLGLIAGIEIAGDGVARTRHGVVKIAGVLRPDGHLIVVVGIVRQEVVIK